MQNSNSDTILSCKLTRSIVEEILVIMASENMPSWGWSGIRLTMNTNVDTGTDPVILVGRKLGIVHSQFIFKLGLWDERIFHGLYT